MTSEDLQRILEERTELNRLDFKMTFNWNSSTKLEKGKLVKDILSMANIAGGGRLVIGVRDGDFEPIGISREDYDSFDTTTLNNFIWQYTDPKHSCTVYKFNIEGKFFVVIEVPEFVSEPIICKKDLQIDGGGSILQKGQIYFRNEAAESISVNSVEDMRNILTRALKNRSDMILQSIQTLLSDRVPIVNDITLFSDSISTAESTVSEKIATYIRDQGLGYITVKMIPAITLENRLDSVFKVKDKIRESQVSYRGWAFPHVQNNRSNGDTYFIDHGQFSFTTWGRHIESFCAFQNGLVFWRGAFWEDIEMTDDRPGRELSFIGFIYSTLEYILFINRYYDFIDIKPDINLEISLAGCNGRKIVSKVPGVMVWDDYICRTDNINNIKVSFNVSESIADPKKYSTLILNQVFPYFGFQLDSTVQNDWQDKFLQKRF